MDSANVDNDEAISESICDSKSALVIYEVIGFPENIGGEGWNMKGIVSENEELYLKKVVEKHGALC